MKLELNAKLVAELELPAGKPEEVCWDIKQPGLGLRLRRGAGNGVVKTWIVQRKKYGRAVKVKIGGADVFGIDAARRAAKQTLAKIDLGGNPAAEARDQAAKKLRKMSALASEYLEHKKRRVRPRSFVEIKR